MKQTVLLAAVAMAALSLAACQKKEAAPEAAAPAPDAAATAAATAPAAPAAAEVASAAQDAAAGPIEAPAAADATTPASATAANANGTESTEALITGVTLSDLYQIEAGKIAETKGQSEGVKDFGKQMVTDHTAMSNQMKHVFAATKTTIPTELGPRGKRMIDALNAATPEEFDKLYLSQQQTAQAARLPAQRLC